eukprot:COSAG04_NODE_15888_length_517_cov_0.741627_1_plen_120_part_10
MCSCNGNCLPKPTATRTFDPGADTTVARCSRQVSALRRELERLGPTALRDRALAAGVSPKMVETWHTTAEYEKEMAAMRTEMRQLRANIGAGGIVRRELVQQVGPTAFQRDADRSLGCRT